jgi:hypothetical protein
MTQHMLLPYTRTKTFPSGNILFFNSSIDQFMVPSSNVQVRVPELAAIRGSIGNLPSQW